MTRQAFDTIDVLALEVERPPAEGELVNLVPNPTGRVFDTSSGWGWISRLPSTRVVGSVNGLEFNTGTVATPDFNSEPFPVTAGHKITGRFRQELGRTSADATTSAIHTTVRIGFLNAVGQPVVPATTAVDATTVGVHFLPVATVPAGATSAFLEILVTRSGGATAAGDRAILTDVMVTTNADPDAFGLTRTNLVANPSFETNTNGWSPFGSSIIARVAAPGYPSEYALRLRPNVGSTANVQYAGIPVTAGLPYTVSGFVRAEKVARNVQAGLRWYSSTGSLLLTSTFDVTSSPTSWLRTYVGAVAPTGAATVQPYFSVLGTSNAESHFLDKVMVEQAADVRGYIVGSQGGNAFDYAEPVYWHDLLGPTHEITVERGEGLAVGTMSATILDASLDPAQGVLIRPGKRVRLRLAEGRPIFTGTVVTGGATYDPRRSDDKRARVTLSAVDAASILATTSRQEGVARIAELPYVLEGCRVPWEVTDNAGNHVASATVVSVNDNASALDQVLMTRDSQRGYAWVTRDGRLRVATPTRMNTFLRTLDETAYSDLDVDFSTDRCINEVRVRAVLPPTDGERSEEVTYGPYRDLASIAEWGSRSAEFTVHGIVDPAEIEAYARAVLTANATPRVTVNSLTMPMTNAEQIERATVLDLYSLVNVLNAGVGVDHTVRVTSIRHSITPTAWLVDLGFAGDGTSAAPSSIPSPSPSGGGMTYTERVRPVGEITMYFGPTPPAGWLLCDGSSFSAAQYPRLAAHLSGTVTPDFTNRFPIGVGANALGSMGGSESHTHGLPNHAHTFSSASNTATVASGGAARINGYTNSGGGTSGASGHLPPYRAIAFIIRAS